MKCFVICKVMKFYMLAKFFCAYLCKIMIKSKSPLRHENIGKSICKCLFIVEKDFFMKKGF